MEQDNCLPILKEMISKIISKEMTFEDFLNTKSLYNNKITVDYYYKFLSDEDKNKFSIIIMDYVDQNLFLLKRSFFTFLTCNKLKASDGYNTFVKGNLNMPKDRDYFIKFREHIKKLYLHEKGYRRETLYCTYTINNKKFEVTDEVIEQAYAYLMDNGYHISDLSLMYICKKIAIGELSFISENEKYENNTINAMIKLQKKKC